MTDLIVVGSIVETKSGRLLVTSKETRDLFGEEEIVYRGFPLLPVDYSNPDIRIESNEYHSDLYLGNRLVEDYWKDSNNFIELKGNVPCLFVIRKPVMKPWLNGTERLFQEFVCGLDLMPDGGVWVGLNRKVYSSIPEALDFLSNELGDDFSIEMEEPLGLNLRKGQF
jgi:hypothetical protein